MEQRVKCRHALLKYKKSSNIKDIMASILPKIHKKIAIYIVSAEDDNCYYVLMSTEKWFDVTLTHFQYEGSLLEARSTDLNDGFDIILKNNNIIEYTPCPFKLYTTALNLKNKLKLYEPEPINLPQASLPQIPNAVILTPPRIQLPILPENIPTPHQSPKVFPLITIEDKFEEIPTIEIVQSDNSDLFNIFCKENGFDLLKNNEVYRKANFLVIIKKSIPRYVVMEYVNTINNGMASYHQNDNFHFVSVYSKKRMRCKLNDFSTDLIEWKDMVVAYSVGKVGISFIKKFKSIATVVHTSLIYEYLGNLLSLKYSNDDLLTVERIITYDVKNSGVDFINEAAASTIMVTILRGLSKYSKSSSLYAFEKQMTLENETRRCDCIYKHKDVLAILEFKCNTTHKHDSIGCAKEREYIEHVLKYLSLYDSGVVTGLQFVVEIGIEFYGKDRDFAVKIKIGRIVNITPELLKLIKEEVDRNATVHVEKSTARHNIKKIPKKKC